jgi:hypothetical protein
VFFASRIRKSRWIVIRSVERRKPSSRASFADVETFAIPTVSNALRRNGSGSAETPSGMPSRWRIAISFKPPPAGSSPTPTSTSPMYVSAAARIRSAARHTSAPPPSAIPAGAATTGCEEYRSRMHTSWNPLTIVSMLPNCLFCASRKTSMRFAPAQKCSAWLAMIKPANSFSARVTPSMSIAAMSASMVFIFVWNSTHNTPSPTS